MKVCMLVPFWLLKTLETSLLTVLVKGAGLSKISEAAEGLHETRLQKKRLNVISQFKEEMSSLRGRVAWWFMSLQIQINVFIRKPNPVSEKPYYASCFQSDACRRTQAKNANRQKDRQKKKTECFVCITTHFSAICLLCVSSFISNQSLTISSKQKIAPQYTRLRFCSAPSPAIEAKGHVAVKHHL